MINKQIPAQEIDVILSPKEIQDKRRRSLTLLKISQQVNSIINQNNKQNVEYEDFIQKLVKIEVIYERQNKNLKQAYQSLLKNYEHIEQMYLITKQELQRSISNLEQKQQENAALEKQINKLKSMVQNQQSLMDQYRTSVQQQIALQKQYMKALIEEQKTKLQKQFRIVLAQIQRQYAQKLNKLVFNNKINDYKVQFTQFKRYIKTNKQNMNKKQEKSSNKLLYNHIKSQYSTNDQQTRHNTAIYIP